MHRSLATVVVLAVPLLAACGGADALSGATTGASTGAPGVQAAAAGGGPARAVLAGFRCPPAGTRVTYRDGSSLTFAVPDPADPATCLARLPDGRVQPRFANLWTAPNAEEAGVRQGMAQLFPLEPGRATSFEYVGRDARSGQTTPYEDSWRVLRREAVPVGDTVRPAVLLERRNAGRGTNSFAGTAHYWLDAETGVLLRREVVSEIRPWGLPRLEAVALDLPAAAR